MKKVLIFFVLAMVVFGSCSNGQKIVGTWTDIEGYTWVFSSNGKLTYNIYEYQYNVTKNKLAFENVGGYGSQVYDISISSDGKALILTGGKNFPDWDVAGPGWSTNQLTRKSNDGNKLDKDLNGTWIGENDTILTYNNGKWKFSEEGITLSKGTYTTSSGKMTETITHISIEGSSRMYSKNEVERDKSLAEYLENFLPNIINYSIRGNTLTQEFDDGETEVYTRK